MVDGYYRSKFTGKEVEEYLDSIKDKQDNIADLEEIRSGASKGATALQEDDVEKVAKSGSYNDLKDKPTIPDAVTEDTVTDWGFTKNTGTYVKPSSGIPKSDLSRDVQTSLGKADTALQEHQDISGKQDVLVSGKNIKTINGQNILGEGDIVINVDTSDLATKDELKKVDDDNKAQEQQISENKSRLDTVITTVFEHEAELSVLTGDGEGSVADIASKEVAKAVASAPEDLEALRELAEFIKSDPTQAANIMTTLDDHESRLESLEDELKIVVMSEGQYELLPEKEDKLYFLYED